MVVEDEIRSLVINVFLTLNMSVCVYVCGGVLCVNIYRDENKTQKEQVSDEDFICRNICQR